MKELSGKELIKNTDKLIKEQPEIFEALLEAERTGRVPKFTHKKRIDITIDSETLRKFREFCRKKGYKLSTRIEKLVIQDLA